MSEEDLATLVDAAVRARPDLPREAFAAHVATLSSSGDSLVFGDLALAFQAEHGCPSAIAELYALVERAARPALLASGYTPMLVDDAIQETATRLLVGVDDERPLLASYRGEARLAAWVKTIALRTASRLAAINGRMQGNQSLLDELAGTLDPVATVVKDEIRPAVRAAFAAAVKSLSYVERELLASVIVRGETIDELSKRHGIHRATAARWVGRARDALNNGLRCELAHALHLRPADVSSVLCSVASSIDLTPGELIASKPSRRR